MFLTPFSCAEVIEHYYFVPFVLKMYHVLLVHYLCAVNTAGARSDSLVVNGK